MREVSRSELRERRETDVESTRFMADVSTLFDIFEGLAGSGKDAVQLRREGPGRWSPISARDFSFTVRSLSLGLNALGIQPGDRVAILSENRAEWAMTDYAVVCGGALTVPIYATLPAEQIVGLLQDSGARAIVVSNTEQLEKIRAIRGRCPALDHVLCIDADPPDEPGYEAWMKTIDRGRGNLEMGSTVFESRGRRISPDPCTIIYTSGTTGEPKGAVLTHGNSRLERQGMLRGRPLRPEPIALSFLPSPTCSSGCSTTPTPTARAPSPIWAISPSSATRSSRSSRRSSAPFRASTRKSTRECARRGGSAIKRAIFSWASR
jgi:long-chain acyl-CoA synthetase